MQVKDFYDSESGGRGAGFQSIEDLIYAAAWRKPTGALMFGRRALGKAKRSHQ